MTSLETLVEPLRHSPQLLEAVALLSRQIEVSSPRKSACVWHAPPGPAGYELKVKAATGTITGEVITGLSLPVRAIFDEAENLAALRLWR